MMCRDHICSLIDSPAQCSGESSLRFSPCMFAPASSSSTTVSMYPPTHALFKAVTPLEPPSSNSQPNRIKMRTTDVKPFLAATSRGEWPVR